MSSKIRIGIVGHGNLGRGVELALTATQDMELVAIFTRRAPDQIKPITPAVPVYSLADIADFQTKVDVLILCGGSKSDLPEQGPMLARLFNTVDSFDTHPKIPDYFAALQQATCTGKTTALISIGWDPGLFSLNRLLGEAILPQGETYTFWGKGVSQGHSDAIRRVPGVAMGVQYTVPSEAAMARVRAGELPKLSTRDKHLRECFVVLKEGADADAVKQAIVTMPDYFADYDTVVHFIKADEFQKNHSAMPHGGFVIRSGNTGNACHQSMEFSLKLDSNPHFTASVLVAYARACHRMARQGQSGAFTLFDVAPALLSPKSAEQLRKELL